MSQELSQVEFIRAFEDFYTKEFIYEVYTREAGQFDYRQYKGTSHFGNKHLLPLVLVPLILAPIPMNSFIELLNRQSVRERIKTNYEDDFLRWGKEKGPFFTKQNMDYARLFDQFFFDILDLAEWAYINRDKLKAEGRLAPFFERVDMMEGKPSVEALTQRIEELEAQNKALNDALMQSVAGEKQREASQEKAQDKARAAYHNKLLPHWKEMFKKMLFVALTAHKEGPKQLTADEYKKIFKDSGVVVLDERKNGPLKDNEMSAGQFKFFRGCLPKEYKHPGGAKKITPHK